MTHEYAGERTELGSIEFVAIDSPPLTIEQKQAIESNPSLNRVIRMIIRCNACGDGITPFVALEQTNLEASDHAPRPIWYKDLGDRFTCTCRKFSFPLRYIRNGMLSLLPVSNSLLPDGSFATTTQVSVQETEKTIALFQHLINENPEERDVQTFIEHHPLMLAPFAARWVKFKPEILNQRTADFGIVTATNDLLLIEIERPSIRLFTQEGMQSAELTHAFWQTETGIRKSLTIARPRFAV